MTIQKTGKKKLESQINSLINENNDLKKEIETLTQTVYMYKSIVKMCRDLVSTEWIDGYINTYINKKDNPTL